MVEPLAAPFNLPGGKVFEVTATDLPSKAGPVRSAVEGA